MSHELAANNIMSVRLTVIPVGAGSPISLLKTINLVNPPRPRYYLITNPQISAAIPITNYQLLIQ